MVLYVKRSLAPSEITCRGEILQQLKNKLGTLRIVQFHLESPSPTMDGLYHFVSTRLHIMEEIETEEKSSYRFRLSFVPKLQPRLNQNTCLCDFGSSRTVTSKLAEKQAGSGLGLGAAG